MRRRAFCSAATVVDRKVVLVGDPPTSGGAVLPNGCKSYVNGVSKATQDSKVRCDACSSIGTIARAGGPFRPGVYGSHEVLEGDLVLCKCAVAPLLIAKAVSSGPPVLWVDDRIEKFGAVGPPLRQFINLTPWRAERPKEAHSIQFAVTNKTDKAALINASYRIIMDNNTEYIGITDAEGLTEIVGNNVPFTAKIQVPYYDGRRKIASIQNNTCSGDSAACSH